MTVLMSVTHTSSLDYVNRLQLTIVFAKTMLFAMLRNKINNFLRSISFCIIISCSLWSIFYSARLTKDQTNPIFLKLMMNLFIVDETVSMSKFHQIYKLLQQNFIIWEMYYQTNELLYDIKGSDKNELSILLVVL